MEHRVPPMEGTPAAFARPPKKGCIMLVGTEFGIGTLDVMSICDAVTQVMRGNQKLPGAPLFAINSPPSLRFNFFSPRAAVFGRSAWWVQSISFLHNHQRKLLDPGPFVKTMQ